MYKSVEKKIKELASEGIPEDFLRDVAEDHSVTEDGKPATAQYIIGWLDSEADIFRDFQKDQ